jgi:hypothetical protein
VNPTGESPTNPSRGQRAEARSSNHAEAQPSNAAQPPTKPLGWRAAVTGAAAALLLAAGITAGFALDDDTPDRAPEIAQASTATLDRFMTRLGTEWAAFERLRGVAARSAARYPCQRERQRLDPLGAELDAIGAPNADIRAAAAGYVARLDEVVSLCRQTEMTGREAAKHVRDAQKAWFDVRVKALRLGWNTPCAQRNMVDACAGG